MAKKTGGRVNQYEIKIKPHLTEIIAWRQNGSNEKDIAKKLNVGVSTWERYKVNYEEFREALKKSKEMLVIDIENSLYKAAKGFEYEEKKELIENYGGKKKVKIEKTTKFVKPDVAACIFILSNLASEKWNNKNDFDKDLERINDNFEKAMADAVKNIGDVANLTNIDMSDINEEGEE